METIQIPSECVLDLIKFNTCSYYEQTTYTDLKVNIIDANYSSISNDIISLSRKDLSVLLFNRMVRCEGFFLSVSF